MFKRFLSGSATQKMRKAAIPLGVTAVVLAGYQAAYLRNKYNQNPKLDPPSGPTSGLEKLKNRIRCAKDDIIDSIVSEDNMVGRGINKIKGQLEGMSGTHEKTDKQPILFDEVGAEKANCDTDDRPPVLKKKIKLLVLGDSLVAGVGSDDPTSSPVLPQMIAKALSKVFKSDVEWFSSGIVGGTVLDLRSKVVPKIRQKMVDFHQHSSDGVPENVAENNVEYVVVVVCGLNDWKDMLLNFPSGLWPSKFKSQLGTLLHEIKTTSDELGSPCHIYLPNLPLTCIKSDPKYIMGVKPMGYFVDLLCYIWDLQKQYVAEENSAVRYLFFNIVSACGCFLFDTKLYLTYACCFLNSTIIFQAVYIGSPDVNTHYATPGDGNVSSDGVHPSSQGCK